MGYYGVYLEEEHKLGNKTTAVVGMPRAEGRRKLRTENFSLE